MKGKNEALANVDGPSKERYVTVLGLGQGIPNEEVDEVNGPGKKNKVKSASVKKNVLKLETSKTETLDPDADGSGKKAKWEPKNWQEVLENIKTMRAAKDAPVDTMGCERTMEENVEPNVTNFSIILIGIKSCFFRLVIRPNFFKYF